jgi:hypothetical protein
LTRSRRASETATFLAALRNDPIEQVFAELKTLGNVGFENEVNEKGEPLIWLARDVVGRLRSLRGPGESWQIPAQSGAEKQNIGRK